ncbi:hypothetical protein O3M35_004703 [Rhynocoris fuscipes]|uniref:Uncharacterized protein n=1 Tax=Rhynocoris fuscipes TaxID=488301 RepID=A0AAW1CGH1_9HEMI
MIFFSFLFFLFTAGRTNTNEDSNVRNKRSYPSETLFPFPRVGRSKQFPMTWGILDEDGKIKREGLIPMGRNGRSGPKRNGGASNGGALWFGPRLGRSQKRGDSWSIDQLNPNFFQGKT